MTAKHAPVGESESFAGATLLWPLWLRICFWTCVVIAAAVVVRRLFALAYPATSGPPQMVMLDAWFVSHRALTLAHIIPALAFVVLTPLVFTRGAGRQSWSERLLFPIGGVVGLTAYAMSVYAVGGWVERSAVLLFNTLFLYSLARAYWYSHRRQALHEYRWLTRAVAILLGIATTRPVMGVFFATSPITRLEPRQFFGVAFWIGFSINTIFAELWLRSRQGASLFAHLAEDSDGADERIRSQTAPGKGLRDAVKDLHDRRAL